MPEWPEMEHYRSQLAPLLSGKKIHALVVNRQESINESAETFINSLVGRTILFVEHRGKFLFFHLDDGNRLYLDLGLHGWLTYGELEEAPTQMGNPPYSVRLSFEDGFTLSVGGTKQVFLHRMSAKAVIERMKELGPDPLDSRLTEEAFTKRIRVKKGKLKATLSDQRFLSGIGSIYSDEICYEARIHPAAPISALNNQDIGRLYGAMRHVLLEAKEAGGSMPLPLTPEDTQTGGYKMQRRVYDRQGDSCPNCGEEIKYETQAGRKMFYCPQCQKEA